MSIVLEFLIALQVLVLPSIYRYTLPSVQLARTASKAAALE